MENEMAAFDRSDGCRVVLGNLKDTQFLGVVPGSGHGAVGPGRNVPNSDLWCVLRPVWSSGLRQRQQRGRDLSASFRSRGQGDVADQAEVGAIHARPPEDQRAGLGQAVQSTDQSELV